MAANKTIKVLLLTTFSLLVFAWMISGSFSTASGEVTEEAPAPIPELIANAKPDDYVGSEACAACHEDQFKSFSSTKHAKLKDVADWRDKAKGCESCHGPGKAHMEDATDLTRIISFKNKTSKEVSETCLTCHSGNRDHINFRRSDHFKNNVGCVDCHTAHGPESHATEIGSVTNPTINSDLKPGSGTLAMLKFSEPQLCLKCHTETKAQFSQPFHHKVLEGQMKCSDCHSAHGSFEMKNARLAVGGDSACIKCHSDKKGPFVYEHLPITAEGCATCHNTHGSSNPKMLKRSQVRQLCLECHSSIFESIAPNAPSFHNQANVRYQNCTICHTKIHGSQTHPAFFR
ncbi:MAG: DmsE family decaheme c-type cytochrome [Pyrinomonadaceae bacterium]